MASNTDEILHEFSLMGMRVYKDGRIERYLGSEIVPPSLDPETGVQSKDVTIDPETGVSARLYIPKITDPDREKLPLVVYFHGGGFCVESAFSPTYQNFLNPLVAEARVVLVSVDYRRAPEHPLPIAYDDSWAAVKWVTSHSSRGPGKEDWLLDHADFNKVFFGGDSAGANIGHHMGTRVGSFGLFGSNLVGVFMLCPYFFWRNFLDRFGEIAYRYWELVNPHSVGSDDPCMNPGKDPKLSELACRKVLVCVAEKDSLLEGAKYYYEVLRESNWGGVVELFEEEGEEHIYFLVKPTCEKTVALLSYFSHSGLTSTTLFLLYLPFNFYYYLLGHFDPVILITRL